MKVRIFNGGDEPYASVSWLRYWEHYSKGGIAGFCKERCCVERAEVGVHVQCSGTDDRDYYIVPLCRKHAAMKGKEIHLAGNPRIVPVPLQEA